MPRFLSTEALDDRCFQAGQPLSDCKIHRFCRFAQTRRAFAEKHGLQMLGLAHWDRFPRHQGPPWMSVSGDKPTSCNPAHRSMRDAACVGRFGCAVELPVLAKGVQAGREVALVLSAGLDFRAWDAFGACNDVQPASRGRLSSVVEVPAQVARYLGTIFTEYAPLRCQSSSIRMPRIEFATIDA